MFQFQLLIYIISTLWLFNVAMENDPFMDDCPTKTSIYKGFSTAMLNNQISTLFPIIDHHFPYNSQLHSAGRVGSRPSARPGVLEVVNIATWSMA